MAKNAWHYLGLVAPGLVAAFLLPLVVPVWLALVLAFAIMLAVAALRDRGSARRRRRKLDDWSPAKLTESVQRSRQHAEIATWAGVAVNVAVATFLALTGGLWASGFNLAVAAFSLWLRAMFKRRTRDYEVERAELTAHRPEGCIDLDDMPTERLIAEVLPMMSSGLALTLTSFVGRALAEGWTVDRIIETSNMPGDMVRHYAKQAERGY